MNIDTISQEIEQDEEGVTITIFKKNEDPYLAADGSEATMTVLGTDAKQVRAVRDRQTRRYLKNQKKKRTPEDLRRNRIELATAAVKAWHGWEDADGAPLPCTPQNVARLLKYDHVLAQIEEASEAGASFFESSSES